MEFNDPLFHIHLNVDFPFKLTGILYFPRIKNNLEVQKIRLTCTAIRYLSLTTKILFLNSSHYYME